MRRATLVFSCLLVACSPGDKTAGKAGSTTGAQPEQESKNDEEGKLVPASPARVWGFDDTAVGQIPRGMTIGETNPHNFPATWAVVARPDGPSAPNAFGVVACDNPKAAVFEVALIDDTSYGDLDAEVWLRALGGEHDQGGGLVWRARDFDNYYVARWNPVEGNLRFYVITDSERHKLAEVDVALEAGKWHRMHLVVEGSHFEVSLDDGDALTLDDTTLTESGRIGLWTKTDAKTLFDELSVTEL